MSAALRCVIVSAALSASGCDKGTYVVVDIDASPSLMAVSIDATLTHGGQSAKAHFDRGGVAFGFPQSFYLAVEGERTGEVEVAVEVTGAGGEGLRGSGSVVIVPNGVARVGVRWVK